MRLAVIAAALTATAVAPAPGQSAAALMEADRAFARAVAAQRLEGWVSFFSDSGTMFRPGGQVVGHAAIREWMGGAFADPTFVLEWDPVRADIAASGDLGYTVGRWASRRIGPDGQEICQTGSYVTVWRRQGDGSWKVAVDIGTPDG